MQVMQITVTALMLALGGPTVALMSLPPADSGLVLVVSPPWVDRDGAIARAGARALGTTISLLGTLVQADSPGFGASLRAAGPFLVLDGGALASLCGDSG